MGIVTIGFSPELLAAQIKQIGEKVAKHGIEHLRKEAEEIRDLARDYAPEDEGKLEDAIQVKDEGGGRGEKGRFTRKFVTVWVNPDMPGSGGMRVGDYAYLMHEGLGPYGDYTYNLGKNSAKKDAGRGIVGGKFLERAVEERKPELIKRMALVFKRFFR